MSHKWNVLLDEENIPIRAGYCEFEPKEGESVVEYEGVDKNVLKNLKKKKALNSQALTDLLTLDPELGGTESVKAVVKFLQEKYG